MKVSQFGWSKKEVTYIPSAALPISALISSCSDLLRWTQKGRWDKFSSI